VLSAGQAAGVGCVEGRHGEGLERKVTQLCQVCDAGQVACLVARFTPAVVTDLQSAQCCKCAEVLNPRSCSTAGCAVAQLQACELHQLRGHATKRETIQAEVLQISQD
jgi:hypothetical protein